MIKCPYCQTVHVANTIFCSECGKYLGQTEEQKTEVEIRLKDKLDAAKSDSEGPKTVGHRPRAIRLVIGSQKHEIEMPLDKAIHLGRLAPASNIFPEIDLSQYGTLSKKVSRRHARILPQGNKVLVEDLGSSNGTFVNGNKLDPYLPEPLNDGDTLEIGRLPIEVKII